MSGELFDEADHIKCIGNCFHGRRNAISGALESMSGVGLALGDRLPGAPYDGWNRISKFAGIPAVTSTADDIAAGRTWLDYAIWCGRQRYYMPYYAISQGPVQVGPLKWPYRTGDGTVWWLEVYFTTSTSFVVYARKAEGLLVQFGPGTGGTVVGSYSGSVSFGTQLWTNFSHDGSMAAVHGGELNGSDDLAAAIIVDVTLSGGTETTPPTASCTLAFGPADLVMKWSNDAVWLQYMGATYTQGPRLYDPQWGFYYQYTYSAVVSQVEGDGTWVGEYIGNRVLAVVFKENVRHVLRYEESNFTSTTDQLDVSGTSQSGSFAIRDDSYYRRRRTTTGKTTRRITLDNAPIVELVLSSSSSVSDVQRVGAGSLWPVYVPTPIETILESSSTSENYYVGSTVRPALVNGECAVLRYQRPADNKQVIAAYGNSRHAEKYVEASAPIMEDFAKFSTHPLTGVFDPQFDLYF